ncbi:Transketolase [Ascochyta lentis]
MGGYICRDVTEGKSVDLIIVSTRSEVSVCIEATKILEKEYGLNARVVSMPCQEIFENQSHRHRISVLSPRIPVLSVEAACTRGWGKYAHQHFGINGFGASGPANR